MNCLPGRKNHWWKDGWVCEKCGIKRADYVEQKKEYKLRNRYICTCDTPTIRVTELCSKAFCSKCMKYLI